MQNEVSVFVQIFIVLYGSFFTESFLGHEYASEVKLVRFSMIKQYHFVIINQIVKVKLRSKRVFVFSRDFDPILHST